MHVAALHFAELGPVWQAAACRTDQHCLFVCLHPSAISCPTLTLQDTGGMDCLYFYAMCLQSIPPIAGLHLHLLNVTHGGWDEASCETVLGMSELSLGADP